MSRTLLVTNDFPPRPGGIQSYLQNLVDRLPPGEVTVYAPRWRGDAAFDASVPYTVHRHPTRLMLPTPAVARRAADLVADGDVHTVWFGAAAPLATLAPIVRRAGARRVVASTHGHEVGWSMLPAARQVLGHIGRHTDVVTFVSRYTRGRFAAAFGPDAALEHLPPGVDTRRFAPDADARSRIRARHGLGEAPVVLCLSRLVPRKGQDVLIDAMPAVLRQHPAATLLIVGGGPYRDQLERRRDASPARDHIVLTGSVDADDVPAYHVAADVFAMPARTRGRGLDVEGLGIVYLEASASGVPVVAGDSGGAPETVVDGETGHVVDGRDAAAVADAVGCLLADPERARAMGRAGREWATSTWEWDSIAARMSRVLA
ncbi:glycosyltransferase family 4 protein [Williamsia deligens]|uniref:Glycosyltransferase family 4 protein n=1 Tax=Williamsia deligens TaxID=321325 RepID=A0ABW3GA92_9NOCA|nr:glycosyltransferase family 4 protein [Williamsia deligens]MCP2195836.1 phosphatidylinositol alpha-1,6-mannosyltransferase [Williamsia deligens]